MNRNTHTYALLGAVAVYLLWFAFGAIVNTPLPPEPRPATNPYLDPTTP